MSLQTQIQNLATRIATECKAIRVAFASVTGDKATLTTVNKSTLVAAINELQSSLSGAASISDTASDTSHTWSASKIIAELNAAKAEWVATLQLVGGADLNTQFTTNTQKNARSNSRRRGGLERLERF